MPRPPHQGLAGPALSSTRLWAQVPVSSRLWSHLSPGPLLSYLHFLQEYESRKGKFYQKILWPAQPTSSACSVRFMGNQNGSMVLGLKTRIKYVPWPAGWCMGRWVCAAPPCHVSAGVSLSSLPATGWACYLMSIRGQRSEWKTLWGRPCITIFLGQGWSEGTQPTSCGQLVSTTLGSVHLCPCCLSPGTWARAPAPDAGATITGASSCPGRMLRNVGPGVGTATVTPSCPSSAPCHRRSSLGHVLSSHPHLCPRRTGAPWPWSGPHCPSSFSSVMPLLGAGAQGSPGSQHDEDCDAWAPWGQGGLVSHVSTAQMP